MEPEAVPVGAVELLGSVLIGGGGRGRLLMPVSSFLSDAGSGFTAAVAGVVVSALLPSLRLCSLLRLLLRSFLSLPSLCLSLLCFSLR